MSLVNIADFEDHVATLDVAARNLLEEFPKRNKISHLNAEKPDQVRVINQN